MLLLHRQQQSKWPLASHDGSIGSKTRTNSVWTTSQSLVGNVHEGDRDKLQTQMLPCLPRSMFQELNHRWQARGPLHRGSWLTSKEDAFFLVDPFKRKTGHLRPHYFNHEVPTATLFHMFLSYVTFLKQSKQKVLPFRLCKRLSSLALDACCKDLKNKCTESLQNL